MENTKQKQQRVFVGQTLDNPKGHELFLYDGMWLSELDIEMIKISETHNNSH